MWRGDDRPGERFDWPRTTLDTLEGVDSGEPGHDSGLVIRFHALRKTPLRDWTVDDLRLMLGQRDALPVLLPLALDLLEDDPFAGEWGGNLLAFALMAGHQFWLDHPSLWRRMAGVVSDFESALSYARTDIAPAVARLRAAGL